MRTPVASRCLPLSDRRRSRASRRVVCIALLALAATTARLSAQDVSPTVPNGADDPLARTARQTSSTQPLLSVQFISPAPSLPVDQVQQALRDLDSRDLSQAQAARVTLMGMPRSQLDALHAEVQRLRTISPATATALHQIVLHDFLADEPYACLPSGFLGLRWSAGESLDEPPRMGVPVDLRLAGFPSDRFLRTGDLILGVLLTEPSPQASPASTRLVPTLDLAALQNAVNGAGARRNVELDILRQGEHLHVTLVLYPKPEIQDEQVESVFDHRRERGEQYWHQAFLPLLKPGLL